MHRNQIGNTALKLRTPGNNVLRLPHRNGRTWTYVDTEEKLIEARWWIKKYLRQSYKDEEGRVIEPARLALDVETYRKFPPTIPSKVPRAIWNGENWEGYLATIQIGFDTTSEFKIRDMQFIFDVKKLGEDLVAAALKDLIEDSVIISHLATYELSFLKAFLGCEPKWVIDLLLVSQILRAGDAGLHDLGSCYETFLRGKGIFKSLTGMTFREYRAFKKQMQKSDWSLPEYTKTQLRYASDDVRLVFPLYEVMCEWIDEYKHRYERKYPPGKGIEEVIGLELALRPAFTSYEQDGIRFDLEYYNSTALPLMRKMLKRQTLKLAQYPEFRPDKGTKEKHLVFNAVGVALEETERPGKKTVDGKKVDVVRKELNTTLDAKFARILLRDNFAEYPNLSFKLNQKKFAGRREIRLTWEDGPKRREVYNALLSVFSEEKGYTYKVERLINMNAKEQVKKALSKITGLEIVSADEDELRKLIDPDKPKTHVIEEYLRWQQCNTVYSRYGEGLVKWVTPAGRLHAQFQQIGRDDKEMATGRSSCKDYNLMFITGRDVLYSWSKRYAIDSGKLVRSAFVPDDDDCCLVDFDLSQIEPRVMTQVTKDKNLVRVFLENLDMHKLSAAKFLRKQYDEVTKEERDNFGKTTNLGKSYNMKWRLLREHIRKSTNGAWYPTEKQAKKLDKEYDELYPGIPKHAAWSLRIATKQLQKVKSLAPFLMYNNEGRRVPFGRIVDDLGRPRFFFVPREYENKQKWPSYKLDEDYNPTEYPYFYNEYKRRLHKVGNAAHNMRIQGTAAEILKFAQLYFYRAVRKKREQGIGGWGKVRVLLIIHDELLVNCPKSLKAEVVDLVARCMLKAGHKFVKIVPIEVEGGVGDNWYQAKKPEKKEDRVKYRIFKGKITKESA